jgi:hypothetical protein
MTSPRKGLLVSGCGFMTPKKDSILLLKNLVKWLREARGANVQQFKSNAQISLKRLLVARPPKTKSLEPTKVMVW